MGNTARGRYQTRNGIVRFKNQKLKNNNDVIFKIQVFQKYVALSCVSK